MKVVVLDGYTLNPGDLDWSPMASCGELVVHDRTPADLTVERAAGAEIVLTNKVVLGEAELAALPDLKYIGILATGVNVVDLEAAKAMGIVVTNVPAYSTPAVAQQVFALLLELTRGVGQHAAMVREGVWSRSPDFCFWKSPQVELAGMALGLVGFGRIGQAVARMARAFDMQVLVHTRTPAPGKYQGISFVSLDELFATADIVSLHCPLTPATESLVDAGRLAQMKSTAYLINTGRGPLIDENALAKALREGRIAGAGLDVLSTEPPLPDNPLLDAPNCLITPHIAWATGKARQRLMDIAVANVKAFQAGVPQNQVT